MNSCAILLNAHRANRFQLRGTTFSLSAALVTGDCHGIVSHEACDIALRWATAAFASQGPGGGPGTAGSLPPTGDGYSVYGASALVASAGMIGAARRR